MLRFLQCVFRFSCTLFQTLSSKLNVAARITKSSLIASIPWSCRVSAQSKILTSKYLLRN